MARETLSNDLLLRHIERSDHSRVLSVVDRWWGGRAMSARLSHVFFVHFQATSFLVECEDELLAFLLGFVSQTAPEEAYVHFIGVHPDCRQLGLARRLYELFFSVVGHLGCVTVRSHTSPENQLSIAFHTAMGFDIQPGDDMIDYLHVWRDYAGPGEHRVRFIKNLRCAPTFDRPRRPWTSSSGLVFSPMASVGRNACAALDRRSLSCAVWP